MTGDDPRPSNAVYRVSGATGRHEPVARGLVVVVVALAIVIAKPWSNGPTTDERAARIPAPATGDPQPSKQAVIAATSADPRSGVTDICLEAGAWLVTSVERDKGRTIRVWRTMLPAPRATGPLDPRIPQMRVRSEGVLELGWCAPERGVDAPADLASVDVWQTKGDTATPIHPVDPLAGAEPSAYGALYLPVEPAASSWGAGTYVFRHASSNGQERWFSLRVELRPALLG